MRVCDLHLALSGKLLSVLSHQVRAARVVQQAADLFRTNFNTRQDLAVIRDVNFGPGHEFLWVRKGLPVLVSQVFDNDGKEFTHSTRLPILRKEPLLSSDRGRPIVSKKRCANGRVKPSERFPTFKTISCWPGRAPASFALAVQESPR